MTDTYSLCFALSTLVPTSSLNCEGKVYDQSNSGMGLENERILSVMQPGLVEGTMPEDLEGNLLKQDS